MAFLRILVSGLVLVIFSSLNFVFRLRAYIMPCCAFFPTQCVDLDSYSSRFLFRDILVFRLIVKVRYSSFLLKEC